MAKFKVGDKVKVVSNNGDNMEKNKYIGYIFTVDAINPNGKKIGTHYGFMEDCPFIFFEGELELLGYQCFTKYDIVNGMVAEFRNGFRGIIINDYIIGESVAHNLDDYDDTLKRKNSYNDKYNDNILNIIKNLDIIKIYDIKSCIGWKKILTDDNLELIWERKEPKKMTVAQIEEEVGYEIDIVNEV